ncbi:DNA polymerase III subunit beta [Pontibacter sp. G13]|uniref:DNA polymerase III subunit beta n=1 Tax=Pontibacter sp. G13 TaxID=3074898 RepID=UPI0028891B5D|nr:DNA polymerase III subunit beta [Pontibacter sp. G13]WNJ21216.1 DNA polymerase III subunit beta [Pontibacter sp. G13]
MNFIVSSAALHRQLSRISGAIPSKSVLPIIENFLFVIENNQLTVSTTNLEISMQTHLEVESRGESIRVAIPARILMDILKALPEQPVTFIIREDTFQVEISSENGKYKLSGENGEDFPIIPTPEGTDSLGIPMHVMLKAISKTLFAASSDEDKAALNGIFFDLNENFSTFVATDAHRLVRYRRNDLTVSNPTNFIVPRQALNLLKSSLDPNANRDVIIQYNDSNAFFKTEDLLLVCRLIDQKYPDYENVIPTDNPNKLFISKQELLGTLRRVNIFANKSTHQVRFSIKGSELEISCEDNDFSNEARETLKCHYEGQDVEIGFNASLLLDVVSNVDTAETVIELSEPNRAGIILPNAQEEGENILMLIMPIMLNSYVGI